MDIVLGQLMGSAAHTHLRPQTGQPIPILISKAQQVSTHITWVTKANDYYQIYLFMQFVPIDPLTVFKQPSK